MPRVKQFRRRARSGGKPATKVGQLLQEWHQNYTGTNLDFNALASGGDLQVVVVDNSGLFTNSILKWSKLKLTLLWEPTDLTSFDDRAIAVMLCKLDQDDLGTAQSVDVEENVRELRRDGKLVRGPWIVHTPNTETSGFHGPYSLLMKPIILKNFTMDREEDLVFCTTNMSSAFQATSQILDIFSQGFVRIIT